MRSAERAARRFSRDLTHVSAQEVRVMANHDASAPASGFQDVPARLHFYCTVCDHEADVTWKIDPFDGKLRPKIGSFSDRCPRGGDCLRAIAAELRCRGDELYANPATHLEPWLVERPNAAGQDGQPEPLPLRVSVEA